MDKLNETWTYCVQRYGYDRCIALTCHGSQNYELDLPTSDFDAKLIIAPTWNEVIFNHQPLSQTINGPYGDINVTDVRLFIGNNLKKQNFNFLECLFTKYQYTNPLYKDLWDELLQHREEIAHYDPHAAVRTMMGQVENQWKRWDRFDNTKTLYHMARIWHAICAYTTEESFADTLVPTIKPWIMEVRLGNIDPEDMSNNFKLFHLDAQHYADKFYKTDQPVNYVIGEFMDELQKQFIYRALYELRCEE